MAGRKKPTGPFVGQEALTIAKTSSGSHAYIYKGQPVPKDIPDDEVQRLFDEGFIGEAVVVEEPTPKAAPKSRSKPAAKPETPQEPPVTPEPVTPEPGAGE